jgi:TonB-dependent SusC/RagA subfamily outer membrane receptor
LVVLPAWAAGQEPVTITGRVTGPVGEPLRDVNVVIFDIGLSAFTTPDGVYRLVVPGARAQGQPVRLTARLIAYRAQTFTVTLTPGATIEQNFQLAFDPLRLDEIVVTGAGTEQLAERLGTARSNLDAATLQRANEPNVVQALAGKVPGVLTNQGSGDAGASTAIQIRGAKTFGTSQPVIYVDGVPMSNATRGQAILSGAPSPNRAADINAEDIESVEVLKGAAATSIYGASAGSAGAILITTKRGRAGRTTYSLRSSLQLDDPVKTLPVQRRFGVGSGGVSSQCTAINCRIDANFFSWGPELAPGTPTFDHGAEMYESGSLMDNTLSVSGGTERTTFTCRPASITTAVRVNRISTSGIGAQCSHAVRELDHQQRSVANQRTARPRNRSTASGSVRCAAAGVQRIHLPWVAPLVAVPNPPDRTTNNRASTILRHQLGRSHRADGPLFRESQRRLAAAHLAAVQLDVRRRLQ